MEGRRKASATESPTDCSVPVRVPGRDLDYPVEIRTGLLGDLASAVADHLPAFRYAILTDETVAELYGFAALDALGASGMDVSLFTFPGGEKTKTRHYWSRLTDQLLESGFGRDSAIISLGGGVTGDLAGFVAATYMRGIPIVQLPTTYVAMMDASVGGKTGVDVDYGKNLVGAFHPPRAVLIDPAVALTLPEKERRGGLAEALKHGAILDPAYLEGLSMDRGDLLAGLPSAVGRAVLRSVQLKAEVVGRDEREGGYRQILNFGHTIAHALELCSDFEISHGEAVAIGMVAESRLGEQLGVTASGTSAALEAVISGFGLPVRVPAGLSPQGLVDATRTDKKARQGAPRYVLLAEIGQVAEGDGWSHEVGDDQAVMAILADMQAASTEVD